MKSNYNYYKIVMPSVCGVGEVLMYGAYAERAGIVRGRYCGVKAVVQFSWPGSPDSGPRLALYKDSGLGPAPTTGYNINNS